MAITWYQSAGQPSDSVGAPGDLNWDTQNRITWGPKTSANTWVGTAYSNIGPTGPAMLQYQGVPPASFGQIGNGCADITNGNLYYKTSSGWQLTGTMPVSTTLTTPALGTVAAAYGPSVAVTNFASTSAAQSMPLQGTGIVVPFVPPAGGSAMLGYQLTSTGSSTATFTISLVDITANTTLFSTTIAKGTVSSTTYAATAYPMVAGDSYVWQISGAGTAYVALSPLYLQPAGAAISASFYAPWALTGIALGSGQTDMRVPGGAAAGQTQYYRNSKTSYLYQAQLVVGPGSGSVTFSLTSASVVYTAAAITANANSPTIVNIGPFGPSTALLAANTNYFWQATGSGTLNLVVSMQVVQ